MNLLKKTKRKKEGAKSSKERKECKEVSNTIYTERYKISKLWL